MTKKEYMKKYWIEHKEEMLKSHKEWYKNNIVEINKKRRKYCLKIKEQISKWGKEYRKKYSEQIRQRKKEEYLKNKESYIARAKRNITNRRKTDVNFRLLENLRHRVNMAVRGVVKSAKTIELVGCSVDKLKQHLESQFKPNMSWDNYGQGYNGKGMTEWHIDHIRPCASFDLSKSEEQRKCFNYSNLQPLWAEKNFSKNDTWVN